MADEKTRTIAKDIIDNTMNNNEEKGSAISMNSLQDLRLIDNPVVGGVPLRKQILISKLVGQNVLVYST